MSSPEFDAREFAELAATMQAESTPTETAEQVVAFARQQLDADHAGITLIASGGRGLRSLASTDPVVKAADDLQNELREGPCRDRSWHGQTLAVPDLRDDPRWPRWGPKTAELGITSLLAVELTVKDDRIGSINVYSRLRRDFSQDDLAYAHIFARHAAVALQASMEVANLNVALDARKVIGQAQGILMERYALNEAQAFEILKRYSQDHNVKLRKIAEGLAATRSLPVDTTVSKTTTWSGP
jgi:GAF domain-containing protein